VRRKRKEKKGKETKKHDYWILANKKFRKKKERGKSIRVRRGLKKLGEGTRREKRGKSVANREQSIGK